MATTFDIPKNLIKSTVVVAPVTPTAGSTLKVTDAFAAKLPAAPFNMVVWPVNTQPDDTNAEIIRVTSQGASSLGNTILNITRTAEYPSVARSIIAGDQIALHLTAKEIQDIITALNTAETSLAAVVAAQASDATSITAINAILSSISAGMASYTVTPTNFSKGTGGTLTGKYLQTGKFVMGIVSFGFSSSGTPSAVTGRVIFSLPVTASANMASLMQIGSATLFDSGVQTYPARVHINSSTTAEIVALDSSGTYLVKADLSSVVPFSWGNLDNFSCLFFYEAA